MYFKINYVSKDETIHKTEQQEIPRSQDIGFGQITKEKCENSYVMVQCSAVAKIKAAEFDDFVNKDIYITFILLNVRKMNVAGSMRNSARVYLCANSKKAWDFFFPPARGHVIMKGYVMSNKYNVCTWL